jgi:hypothetical protein
MPESVLLKMKYQRNTAQEIISLCAQCTLWLHSYADPIIYLVIFRTDTSVSVRTHPIGGL